MRKVYIDVLTVISALAVVFLHANGCFWRYSTEEYWFSANVIESLFYFAVPVFFMISGATLIDYRERYNTIVYIRKRVSKTLIPFLIWSVLGILYMKSIGSFHWNEVNIKWIINSIFNTGQIPIYWFFISLYAIYMVIPFIAKIPKDSRKRIFLYMIIGMLILNAALPLLFKVTGLTYNDNIKIPVKTICIYVFIGYYIDNYKIKGAYRYGIYLLSILGLIMHIAGTWILSTKSGCIIHTYKGYENLPCILYSSGIFLFFKQLDYRTAIMKILDKFCTPFYGTTLGIYLIHWYLLDQIIRNIKFLTPFCFAYRIGGAIFVFITASCIIRAIQKIPLLNRIVP